jgi:TRAP-type C4-dicarboxylate transport system substrate-binding protein
MAEMRPTAAPAYLAAAVLLVGAAACSQANGLDKSGGSPPVRLTFANSDADLGALPAVQYFLDRVKQLSGGQLQIDVRSSWGGGAPGYEPGVLRDVRGGKADLAWLGTRVFDTAGVHSFQALSAPLLVDSYALEKAVLQGPLPARMLVGLQPIGLVGLTVLGDKLRKPFGTKHYLLEPADYAGLAFRTYDSDVQEQAVRALGADPSDIGWAGLYDALKSGTLQGTETDLRSYTGGGDAAVAPYATVNVNLWPRTTALVANASAFARLTRQQQGWLKRAAAEASTDSLALLGGDEPLLAQSCSQGARPTFASRHDIALLEKTFKPVYTRIERDPRTRSLIASIEAVKQSVKPKRLTVPATCRAKTAVTQSAATSQRFPHGVYRFSMNRADILRALPTASEQDMRNVLGVFTWTFKDGTVTMHQRADYPPDTHWKGRYTVDGNLFTVHWSQCEGCPLVEKVRWTFDGRALHMHTASPRPGDILTWNVKKPWVKIG